MDIPVCLSCNIRLIRELLRNRYRSNNHCQAKNTIDKDIRNQPVTFHIHLCHVLTNLQNKTDKTKLSLILGERKKFIQCIRSSLAIKISTQP